MQRSIAVANGIEVRGLMKNAPAPMVPSIRLYWIFKARTTINLFVPTGRLLGPLVGAQIFQVGMGVQALCGL
jgi:hypothetical protein